MALVSLAQARAHVRVEDDYPAEQLQPYIDGAQDSASKYLNRTIFETTEARADALTAMPDTLKAAQDAFDAAVAAAEAVDDPTLKQAMLEVAAVSLAEARTAADWDLYGVVVTPSILTAVLLILGHLFANRESVVVGAAGAGAAELPQGSKDMLRHFRRVMMP